MPLYEYECENHGGFELLRSISEYSAPGACPDCGESGKRVVSTTRGAVMARSEVIARDRNERSRHEPRMSRTAHGHNHAECAPSAHSHKKAPAPTTGKPQLKAYTGKRPWVIEHG